MNLNATSALENSTNGRSSTEATYRGVLAAAKAERARALVESVRCALSFWLDPRGPLPNTSGTLMGPPSSAHAR